MITIAEPLLPREIDLKGFDFMPLYVERLLASRTWIRARQCPALGFYLVNLWAASWRECPPGSLDHDDLTLAEAARCEGDQWLKMRNEILATWAMCPATGRIYHPVVCELAIAAFRERLNYRKAAAKKHGKRFEFHVDLAMHMQRISDASAALKETAKSAATAISRPPRNLLNGKDDHAMHMQGEGEGKKEKVENLFGESLPSSDRPSQKTHRPPRASVSFSDKKFDEFWTAYPLKVKRDRARRAFAKALEQATPAAIMAGLARYIEAKPEWQQWAHPASWLNDARWNDQDAAEGKPVDWAALRAKIDAEGKP